MKGFSIFYEISKHIVRVFIRIYYKKIVFIPNHKPIIEKGPILICCNHVNAFIDPILIQVHSNRQLYSLARGDAFKGKIVPKILKKLKIIPIYRISEGLENLHKNQDTFQKSISVLQNKNAILIYPEGICIQEKRLRKLKKGAARIALEAEEKENFLLNLTILPIALNYDNAKKPRTDVYINTGKSIKTSSYQELYKTDKVKAINKLTESIEKELESLMVTIEDSSYDELFDFLDEILKNEFNYSDSEKFNKSKILASFINKESTKNNNLFKELQELTNAYKHKLSVLGISDLSYKSSFNALKTFINIIAWVIGLPLFIIGTLLNFIPIKIGLTLSKKIAKNIEFYSSVLFTISMFTWIIYYLMIMLIINIFTPNIQTSIIISIIIPILGLFSLHYAVLTKKIKVYIALIKMKKEEKEELSTLRKNIVKKLDLITNE